jgi:hypothetical protein
MRASKAKRLRALIEALADFLADEEALEGVELFRKWDSAGRYTVGQRVRYDGILYRCLQSHTAQAGWTPAAAASLWARVLIEDPNAVPDWVQPESTNGYMIGDRVRHHEKIWVSLLDHNIWEPGIYGWEEKA